ncbi:MAG: hypothetical protein KGH60_04605 [Candidatus Micrarchaeota archaeon]|nr:hypothetical protein [Candidatus Micrarchaeota archaeon]
MDKTNRKQDLDAAIDALEKDGTMATFNKANELFFEHKDTLTPGQRLKLEDKMKCLECDRTYCDHPRPE